MQKYLGRLLKDIGTENTKKVQSLKEVRFLLNGHKSSIYAKPLLNFCVHFFENKLTEQRIGVSDAKYSKQNIRDDNEIC